MIGFNASLTARTETARDCWKRFSDVDVFRESKPLKYQMSAYRMALDQPALWKALERKHGRTEDDEELNRRMLLSAIRKKEFTIWYLLTRFPQLTPQDWIGLVLNVHENELRPDMRVAAEPGSTVS